jgi:hypothetical protein
MTNKPIRTYNDLLEEKQQLEVLLKAQKELIRYDFKELKAEFQPVIKTVGLAGKMFTKDKTNALLNTGADTLIDIIVKRVLLGKAGWITRTIVPFLIKNVSSHVIADKKDGIIRKVFSLFRKDQHNGKTPPDPDPAAASNSSTNGAV